MRPIAHIPHAQRPNFWFTSLLNDWDSEIMQMQWKKINGFYLQVQTEWEFIDNPVNKYKD